MQNNSLPADFVTMEDAIKIIESDTRSNPVVDVAFLINNIPYMRVNGNYNIKLLTRNADGKIVENGSRYVRINSEWEKANLEHAILEHYKQNSRDHKEIDPNQIGLRSLSTTKDEDNNPQGKIIKNPTPMIKYGDSTQGGERTLNK